MCLFAHIPNVALLVSFLLIKIGARFFGAIFFLLIGKFYSCFLGIQHICSQLMNNDYGPNIGKGKLLKN